MTVATAVHGAAARAPARPRPGGLRGRVDGAGAPSGAKNPPWSTFATPILPFLAPAHNTLDRSRTTAYSEPEGLHMSLQMACAGLFTVMVSTVASTGCSRDQGSADRVSKGYEEPAPYWTWGNTDEIDQDFLLEVVEEIESVHCTKSDSELAAEGLSDDDIEWFYAFCENDSSTKFGEVYGRFSLFVATVSNPPEPETVVDRYDHSYSCWYGISYNWGIPNYSDLSVTSCTWHDSGPSSCSTEGGYACLWGCNNVDSTLGWSSHEKYYSSTTSMVTAVTAKGYAKLSWAYGGDYSRAISYGYRWQVSPQSVDSSGKGTYHNEGPEPNPAYNSYAFARDWWPTEVGIWHLGC